MFERYTEQARRVIFFARYHASEFGQRYIGTEHLLLGLLREDRELAARLDEKELRRQVEEATTVREKIATSVDLPLSPDARQVLAWAAEASHQFGHQVINTGHLTLGLLRIGDSLAARFLNANGIEYDSYRAVVEAAPQETRAPEPKPLVTVGAEAPAPVAPSLASPIHALLQQLTRAVNNIDADSEAYAAYRLKRRPFTRKEAMGHLVNLAAVHLEWLARAMTEPSLTVAGCPADEWVKAQRCATFPWHDLVDLWVSLNRLLAHVLAAVPEEKLTMPCQVGIGEPQTLEGLIHRYVSICEDLIGQVLARL